MSRAESDNTAAHELKTRVGNVERDAQSNKTLISGHVDNASVHVPAVSEETIVGSTLTVSGDKKAVWNKDTHAADLKAHAENAEIHVSEELKKHPENQVVHLPIIPGSDGEVLVYEDGIPKPKRLNADAFEGLQLDVSAATIARAFSSYLTKSWSMPTSPFRQNLADPERVLGDEVDSLKEKSKFSFICSLVKFELTLISWPEFSTGEGPAGETDGPAGETDGPAGETDGPAGETDGPARETDGTLNGTMYRGKSCEVFAM